jgi:transposase
VTDVTEILVHWYAGRSQSEIATSLGLDRKTIRKYLAPAIGAGMSPGGPPVSTREWAELVGGWFPELADARLRQITWPAIEQYRDYIARMLAAGVSQATIHQRLRDEQGLQASLASLKRWVAANLPEEIHRGQVTVLGDAGVAGESAQIDYGHLGAWVDPRTGNRHRVWAFVMVLVCSRFMFVRLVLRMDQRAWTEAHVEAFAFFGGVPARLVPDNLKTGVDKPDLYDPKINRSYAELAAHYGALVDPARALKPKDKPRVERPMPYVRDSFWRGREFTSVAHMQADAITWCREVAGQRRCRPLEGAAPAAVFAAVEAEALKPLPQKRFELATWSTAKVGPDIHVKVEACLYSVPWRHIGRRVDARTTHSVVQIFDNGS